MTQDVRLQQLTQWVHSLNGWENALITTASSDASFRRYFRATLHDKTAIVMDAPPDKEDCRPFVDINQRLIAADVHAPRIMAQNLLDGFLLLEDLGAQDYLSLLNPETADHLYKSALHSLLKLQVTNCDQLPDYHADLLMQEMQLMPEWFLKKHLGFSEQDLPGQLLQQTFQNLVTAATEQPMVFTHRDFHSRNLMATEQDSPGVIDHQGALLGPATYDLVSLLRDCYIQWPEQRVETWVKGFHKDAIAAGNIPPVSERDFLRWFDLMGLQRHIKVLGIFARLYHRDGKEGYLNDLPLVLHYVETVAARHPETTHLAQWFSEAGIANKITQINKVA